MLVFIIFQWYKKVICFSQPKLLLMCERFPKTELFLVRIFLYLDHKKLRIWTLFTQYMWKYETAKEVISNFKRFKHFRTSRPEMFCKRGILGNAATCNFINKETLAQTFSCEFYEISKNTFFHGTPLMAVSGIPNLQNYWRGDSGPDVFLWILRNFQEHLFCTTYIGVFNSIKPVRRRVSLRDYSFSKYAEFSENVIFFTS